MTARTAADLAADLAWRCDGVKQTAEGWMVKCPTHDDSTASLSITPGSDKVLLNCFGGCTNKKDILDALGLGWDALFVQPRSTEKYHDSWADIGPIIGRYDYTDASGTLLHQTVRFLKPDGTKDMRQHRPHPVHPGRWLRRVRDITQVLYHLPAVMKAIAAGELVILVEGEKDADSLEAMGLTATTNAMGVKSWKPHYDEMLRGAHLVCLPDFDLAGQEHMDRVTTRLHGIAASIKLLTDIHTAAPKSDVSDWLADGHTRAELEAAIEACPLRTPTSGAGQAPTQRTIQLDTNLSRIVDEGEAAIRQMRGAPRLYQRARLLTIIARGVKAPEWLGRPPDLPVMVQAAPAYIYELASQAARWEQWDARKNDWKAVLPPRWFVPSVQGRPNLAFPVLSGLVQSPTLRANGTILATPGYDQDTGLYVDFNGTTFPAVPEHPTLEDAQQALKALKNVLVDFPFAELYHRSAALAAILSMACRFAIAGCVPLFAVRATAAGSGKGLLVDALSLIGTGRPAPRWPETIEPEEERKRILTIALAGYPAIHLDNVSKPLGSASLDDALTARTFSDRLLGTQTPIEAPLDLVWFASGNNMQFRTDTSRRVVPIDLDPKMERPEERTTFTHNPLLTYVSTQRPALAVAAVTVLRAFWVAQRPKQTLVQMGSFEAWSDLVRQALVWAGEPDPNEGRKEIDAESTPAHEHLATLLECWAACYVKKDKKEQEEGFTLAQVKDDIFINASIGDGPDTKWDDLRDALGAYDPKYDQKSLNLTVIGAALRERKGSVIDHKRLVKDGTYRRAVKWRLQAV